MSRGKLPLLVFVLLLLLLLVFWQAPELVATLGPILLPVLMLLVGLTVPSDLTETVTVEGTDECLEGELSSPVDGACWMTSGVGWTVTLANLRLAGRYSQGRPAASHLLQCGRSPEHLVL